ncbi:hypothetical protein EYR36_005749 [Pleurotus pulmonarius]|nr:hypothetical protein EYR36_005749 [Pleurotus pulmonarius]
MTGLKVGQMFHTHFRNIRRPRRSNIRQAPAEEDNEDDEEEDDEEEDDDELLDMPVPNAQTPQPFSNPGDEMLDLPVGLLLSPRRNAQTASQTQQLDDELLDLSAPNNGTASQIEELDDELLDIPVSNIGTHLSPSPLVHGVPASSTAEYVYLSSPGPASSYQVPIPAPETPRLRRHSGEEDDVIDIELPGFSLGEVTLQYKDGSLQLSTENAKKCNEAELSRRYVWELQVTQRPKQIVCGMQNGLLRVILPRSDSSPSSRTPLLKA